jgi:uncharacterized protein
MERVVFQSSGVEIVGHLHKPVGVDRAPAIAILGPMTFIKEQAPTQYAERLAQHGFAALVFDPRFHGESAGEPRRWESPLAKVADVRAAADFLTARADIDPTRIATLGICQGSSEVIRAQADDLRIKAGATIAGHYRDHDGDIEWLGAAGLQLRLERGWKAKLAFEASGQVEYVPVVHRTRVDVGMPGEFVWDWYHRWESRGWDNRYAVMSDADLLTYESLSAAARLTTPYMMIHSDNSFLPQVARRHFSVIPASDKALVWEGATPHLSFYDDAAVIDATVAKLVAFYRSRLGLQRLATAA